MKRPSGDQTGDQSMAESCVTGDAHATRSRNGVDVTLPGRIAPIDDAIACRGPERLHRIAVDDPAWRAAGGIDDI